MDNKELLKRLEAGTFSEDNGSVIRAINLINGRYIKLSQIKSVATKVSSDNIFKCINFLAEEGYIHVRNIETKEAVDIADAFFDDLEVKLSGKGERLAHGHIKDSMVNV